MSTKGQALLELILVLPILIALWAAIFWFGRIFITSIELMHTARHGVFWLAYDHSGASPVQERQHVTAECRAFLQKQSPGLNMNQVTITIKPGDRWHATGPKSLTDAVGMMRLITHLRRALKQVIGLVNFQPASILIQYDLPAPPILRLIPGFPSTLPLRGYCVCYR